MNSLEEQLAGVKTVAVAGHIKPDGDCVGSCLATYNYLKDYHAEIDARLFLEPIPNIFKFLSRAEEIVSESDYEETFDLLIVQDCGDLGGLARPENWRRKQSASSALTIISAMRVLGMTVMSFRTQALHRN